MRFFVAVLFLIFGLSVVAQENTYLSDFALKEDGQKVVISWTTSRDFTCEDVKIEHTTDTNNFEVVYTFPGICGVRNEEASYFYIFDNVVFNTQNYFRINLGTFGYSNTLNIHIIQRKGLNPIVVPNPAMASSLIHFSNANQALASIQIHSANGIQIGAIAETQSNYISLESWDIPQSGIYFFTVTMNGSVAKGRFFFQ